jgi:hypothetical protein
LIKNHPNKNFKINIVSSKLCDSMSWLNPNDIYCLYSAVYSTKACIDFFSEEIEILQEHFPHLTFKELLHFTNSYQCTEKLNVVDVLTS